MGDLWKISSAVADAVDAAEHAARVALDLSGAVPGRAPDPEAPGDPGEPGCDGWPAMTRLCDLLTAVAAVLRHAVPPEITDAIGAGDDEDREPIQPGDYHYYRPE